jgi:type II protein arginine methyltransferase
MSSFMSPVTVGTADPSGTRLFAAGLQAQLARLDDLTATVRDGVRQLADGLPDPAALGEQGVGLVPRWHFAMLNDRDRNRAFVAALENRIEPGAHVLDIGSGTGLLAMVAARAGAGHVTTCEANPLLAELAREVIAHHGLSDRITVLPSHSTTLRVGHDLPRKVDLMVSEVVDCGLVGEGILPTLRHARRELVRPGGIIMPTRGALFGQLVDSEDIRRLNHVEDACGFDVSALNALATPGHFPVRLGTWPHRLLCDPVELLEIDFREEVAVDHLRRVAFPVTDHGTAHGVVAWFRLELDAGISLCTAPGNPGSHWMQAFLPFPEPIDVAPGHLVEMDVHCGGTRLTASEVQVSVARRRAVS